MEAEMSSNAAPNETQKKNLNRNFTKKTMPKSIKRQTSLQTYFNEHKQKSPTIISSYCIEEEKYQINQQDIENTEFKQYYIDTITKLNSDKLFDLRNTNLPIFYPTIFHTINALLFGIAIYASTLLVLVSCYNPMIIFILLFVLRQVFKILYLNKYIISSSIKKFLMRRVIRHENEYSVKQFDIYWELGKECLWIELHQNKQEKNVKNLSSNNDKFHHLVEDV